MNPLLTIGYSGLSIDEFTQVLIEHKVKCLIDIRELPISRKKGFSKRAISSALELHGIGYVHLGKLGSPRQLRHEVRETRDYAKFYRGVEIHLQQEESQKQIHTAIQTAQRTRSCLMCFCPDWKYCHRRSVIDSVRKVSDFSVEHLLVPDVAKVA